MNAKCQQEIVDKLSIHKFHISEGVFRTNSVSLPQRRKIAQADYDSSTVGKSISQGSKGGIKLNSIFGNLRNGGGGRQKDTKQKCKSAKYRTQMQVTTNGSGKEKTLEQELASLDESLISDDSGDEFDSMVTIFIY